MVLYGTIYRSDSIVGYVDNEAVIAMINKNRPTTCAHHIEIQHFTIQEW